MTPKLQTLLHNYGLLYISIKKLADERSDTNQMSVAAHDNAPGDIGENEPIVLFRISKTGEHKLGPKEKLTIVCDGEEDKNLNDITILELPEDEFHFIGAFPPALRSLEKELPAFIFGLGQAYAYSLFESYLGEIIRARLKKHPLLMSSKKQLNYAAVLEADSKESLIDALIEKEIREINYLPITGIIEYLRRQLGLEDLPTDNDQDISKISLVRNCLIHNEGKVSPQLAKAFPGTYTSSDSIEFTIGSFESAVNLLKKASVLIDKSWERLD